MALGKGKTEHAGPRDMSRKHGHWGFTEEAKAWASRARRRDEDDELRRELADVQAEPRGPEGAPTPLRATARTDRPGRPAECSPPPGRSQSPEAAA